MKVSLNVYIYIIMMSFIFAFSEVRESVSFYIQMIIGSTMILFLLVVKTAQNGLLIIERNLYVMFLLYFLPQVFLHIWGSYIGYSYERELFEFSSNLSIYYPILLAFFALILFRIKSIDYTLISFAIGMAIKSIYEITQDNIGNFEIIFKPTLEGDFPLEFSDPILCLSYILVCLFFFRTISPKLKNKLILFCLIFLFLGRKRIVLLAAGITMVWGILVNKIIKTYNTKNLLCSITQYGLFIASYIYIFIQSLGNSFYLFLQSHGINLSGRNYFYSVMQDWYKFTPDFMGIGKNATFNLMQNQYSYFGIKAIHSDFLKIYIENGFIVYGLWSIYSFIVLPKIFKKIYGLESMIFLILCNIVMFILYLSDNTDTNFGCRLFLTLLPMAYTFSRDTELGKT